MKNGKATRRMKSSLQSSTIIIAVSAFTIRRTIIDGDQPEDGFPKALIIGAGLFRQPAGY